MLAAVLAVLGYSVNESVVIFDRIRENFRRYRNLVTYSRPPIIPIYPMVNKDLTFIHLGNESYVDGLVNFEKLRMLAKEVSRSRRLPT